MNGFYLKATVAVIDPQKTQQIDSASVREVLASGSTADMCLCVESENELLARRLALNFAYQHGVIVKAFDGVIKSIGKSGKAYVFLSDGRMTRYEPKPLQQETWHDSLDKD